MFEEKTYRIRKLITDAKEHRESWSRRSVSRRKSSYKATQNL